jgi:hypothetical protein
VSDEKPDRSLHDRLDRIERNQASHDMVLRSLRGDMSVCLRGVQSLLLEKASMAKVDVSMCEVDAAVEKLDTEPAPPFDVEPVTRPDSAPPRT